MSVEYLTITGQVELRLRADPVGDSAALLYINEGLIRLAKVAVIARGHLTGLLWCGFCFFRVYDMK